MKVEKKGRMERKEGNRIGNKEGRKNKREDGRQEGNTEVGREGENKGRKEGKRQKELRRLMNERNIHRQADVIGDSVRLLYTVYLIPGC